MKRIFLVMLCFITLSVISGCNFVRVNNLDLSKLSVKLDNLTFDDIDIPSIDPSSMEYFDELEFIYDNDFKKLFNLDKDLITSYSVNYNEKNKQLLAVFEVVDGRKNKVIESCKESMNKIGAKLYEEKGLLIYIASKNNDEVLKRILDTKTPVFGSLMEANDEMIKNLFDIDKDMYDEILVKTPMMMTQSNTVIIVKPKSDKVKEVKEAINKYMDKLEKQWSNYLPDQYDLVKNRNEEKLGDYLVYIISQNNELVFKAINESTEA